MGVGNFGVNPSQLANSAFAKQASQLETRIVERDSNRKDINRVGGNVTGYNEAEKQFRTARVVNKQLSNTLDGMMEASNGLDSIKSQLESIKSIVQDAIDGNISDLDQAQEDINNYVRSIQETISTTEFKDQKIFSGNFETSTLKDIDISKLDLNFENTADPITSPDVLTPTTSLTLDENFYSTNGKVGDDFGEQVLMTDRYIAVASPGYEVDIGTEDNTGAIQIFNRNDGSLVTTIEGYAEGDFIAMAGDSLALAQGNEIEVFDITNGGSSLGFQTTTNPITSVSASDRFIAWTDGGGDVNYTENNGVFSSYSTIGIAGPPSGDLSLSIDGTNLAVINKAGVTRNSLLLM